MEVVARFDTPAPASHGELAAVDSKTLTPEAWRLEVARRRAEKRVVTLYRTLKLLGWDGGDAMEEHVDRLQQAQLERGPAYEAGITARIEQLLTERIEDWFACEAAVDAAPDAQIGAAMADALSYQKAADALVLHDEVATAGGVMLLADGATAYYDRYDEGWAISFYEEGEADCIDLAMCAPEGLPIVAIGEGAFTGCSGITRVALPPTVRKIGPYAFAAMTALEHMELPDSVEAVGCGAFGWSAIRCVAWPAGCPEVPAYAFAGCLFLEQVELPAAVELIDPTAFWGCPRYQGRCV